MALSILASGMVTAVGLNSAAACAAIRCAITNFVETRFIDDGGEWIIGAPVPLDEPWRGRAKLVKLIVPAIQECLTAAVNVKPEEIPLLLCVAEKERPGRLDGLDDQLFEEIQSEMGVRFHPQSKVISRGKTSGVHAMLAARGLVEYDRQVPFCLIAGVDSFLVAPTLAYYQEKERLLTSKNSNGFIPGEAGAAVLVGRAGKSSGSELLCYGIGFGTEKASIESEEPLRADGMAEAIRAALSDAQASFDDVDYRIADLNGEQYGFKEASLAISRTMRKTKPEFNIWHPADCIGEVGAAIVPSILGVTLTAARKNYAPGKGAICHFSKDDGERATMILKYQERRAG